MRRLLSFIVAVVFLATVNAQTYKLSAGGYDYITADMLVIEDVQSVEEKVSKQLEKLEFGLPQEFIDGIILVGMQISSEYLFTRTDIFTRLKKCRINNGLYVRRSDLRFTAAAVLDLILDNSVIIHKYMTKSIPYTGDDDYLYFGRLHKSPSAKASTKPSANKSSSSQKSNQKTNTSSGKASTRTQTKKPSPKHDNDPGNYVHSQKKQVNQVSKRCRLKIKEFESLRLEAYWDTNGYSIGYGHHTNVKKGDKIEVWEAEDYFCLDMRNFQKSAVILLQKLPYKFNFNQGFFDGFVSAMYNMGPGHMKDSKFYKELAKCRVKDGKMHIDDYIRITNLLKATHAPTKGHRDRRAIEVGWMQECVDFRVAQK